VKIAGSDGALTELSYLERAGLGAVALDALERPESFAHAAFFRHAGPRRHAAGAWRALRVIKACAAQGSA
jgi:hypothetical protein